MRAFSTLVSLFSTATFVAALPLVARQALEAPADDTKHVVCHHMVGNTFPYTLKDWQDDVALASSKGIDAFALNMGSDSWQPDRINDAYEAAKSSNSTFKMFLSLDMTVLPCGSPDDGAKLRQLVTSNMAKDSQFFINGKAFVSTFAGENCNFGHPSAQEGWGAEFAQHPDLAGKIHFVPAFFIDPQRFGDFKSVMNGAFAWDSGWPNELTSDVAKQALAKGDDKNFLSTFSPTVKVASTSITGEASSIVQKLKDTLSSLLSPTQKAVSNLIGDTAWDTVYLKGLGTLGGLQKRDDPSSGKPTYMAAAAANFFTHYGADTFNKNFAYLGDQFLLAKRWESIINNRDQYDIIELLTWNDFGESHYIGPIKGALPKSEAWTIGFDHTAFLDVNKYYIEAFKTGKFPEITEDRVVMYSRPHIAAANVPDPVGFPKNADLFQDNVWALIFASAPSTVTLNGQVSQVPKGVSKVAAAIKPGDGISAKLDRNGATTVTVDGGDFKFNGSPQAYNFNYFVVGAGANDGQDTPAPTSPSASPALPASSASSSSALATPSTSPTSLSATSSTPTATATQK
ncbi:glycosyl hydrolase family 71-domain-containing protein [Crepidotus variabilis]|uniref:Glycosyl hydrolase family 71-domain-containing protein n=1 Tax=Crepidotus variabilis TaxID=179855 RepID=A0A9P6ENP8_9AGAR|nr:glycosyl hydrolase family 71-domain-containing protein [Crepidotus variabilis]